MDPVVLWSAVSAIGTAGAAGIAALAARESRWSAQAANAAASTLAAIEQDRRYDELTPRFRITCKVRDIAPGRAELVITLAVGGAQYLDSVAVTILDEAWPDHRGRGLPPGVTQQEAEEFVRGGWEFDPEASSQVASNREYGRGRTRVSAERTRTGSGCVRQGPGHG